MMKLSLHNILELAGPLREISKKNFTGATSFKIARLIRELDNEITLFEESRRKVAMKYCEKDSNGQVVAVDGNFRIKDEYLSDCDRELRQLYNTVVEINADLLPIEAFEDVELTPEQASLLLYIVDA